MRLPAAERGPLDVRSASWIVPWLLGLVVIGYFGRYGGTNAIPNWWDLVLVSGFSIVIYEIAEKLAGRRSCQVVERAYDIGFASRS